MGKYIPNTDAEQKAMLSEIGFSSFDDLFAHVPKEVKLIGELNIPSGLYQHVRISALIPPFISLVRLSPIIIV